MNYLKVWTDFAELIEPLDDAERGRLFTAMLAYAETGEIMPLSGNERFVWPAAKQSIDRSREEYDKKAESGRKGGKANGSKPKQNEANESTEKQTEANGSSQEQDKEQDKDADSLDIAPSSPCDDEDEILTINGELIRAASDALRSGYGQFPPHWANQLALYAKDHACTPKQLQGAIRLAVQHGAASPPAYAMQVLDDMGRLRCSTVGEYLVSRLRESRGDLPCQ